MTTHPMTPFRRLLRNLEAMGYPPDVVWPMLPDWWDEETEADLGGEAAAVALLEIHLTRALNFAVTIREMRQEAQP